MIENLLAEIYTHGKSEAPREACGLVYIEKGKAKYFPCSNDTPGIEHFSINGVDYSTVEDMGEIVYIVHSHPRTDPIPSETDKVSLEQDNIPWLIVNPFLETYTITKPSGYISSYIGRTYHHGVVDCYTIFKDYYQKELGIYMKNYEREDNWWLAGKSLYTDNILQEGFVDVTGEPLKLHDVLFMRVASTIENHSAIYIGNNQILHHPQNRLSTRDTYGGWWQKITSKVYRHKSLL